MQGRRHERVRELLKRELGGILLRELPPAEAGLASVNEVLVSGDLRRAVVYVGFVGDDDARRQAWRSLRKCQPQIQDALAHAICLKHTPRLRFIHDHAIERGTRVLRIIEEIEQELPPDEDDLA
jgi:ribosome-binding factor A